MQTSSALQESQTRWFSSHEREAYLRLLLCLDETSRYNRFARAVNDHSIRVHVKQTSEASTPILGAFINGSLQGAGEFHLPDVGGRAEASFVVDQNWRNRGIGTELLMGILRKAEETNCRSVRMTFLRSNLPMRKLALKANARLDLVLGDMQADIDIGQLVPVVRLK